MSVYLSWDLEVHVETRCLSSRLYIHKMGGPHGVPRQKDDIGEKHTHTCITAFRPPKESSVKQHGYFTVQTVDTGDFKQ